MDPGRREKIESQARMLAVGHFVVGGIVLFFSLLPLIYVVIGVAFMFIDVPQQPGEPPPAFMGAIFAVFGGCATLFIAALGVGNLYGGVILRRMRGRTFLFVLAVLNLLHQPLGLILGIFSLIFLVQADVKDVFEADPELLD